MIRLMRRASPLVALCLLTSAASATAECAWMLWAERASVSQDATFPALNGFQRLAAYGDYGSCARAAKAKAERQAADMRDQYPDVKVYSRINDQWIAEGTHDAINASDNRRFFSDRFMCFPETVDPRGRRGSEVWSTTGLSTPRRFQHRHVWQRSTWWITCVGTCASAS